MGFWGFGVCVFVGVCVGVSVVVFVGVCVDVTVGVWVGVSVVVVVGVFVGVIVLYFLSVCHKANPELFPFSIISIEFSFGSEDG